jgi:hypothetical protein
MDKPTPCGKKERELTYQTGWKKGVIHCKEKPAAGLQTGGRVRPPDSRLEAFLRSWVWRPLPWIPAGRILLLLWILPAVCLILFGALACALLMSFNTT